MAKEVTWVKPELVAEVKFANWTNECRLRAPVYLGLRPDVEPQECVREKAEQPAAAMLQRNLLDPAVKKSLLPSPPFTEIHES